MNKIIEFIKEYWIVAGMVILAAFIMCGCGSTNNVPVIHDTIIKSNTEYVNKIFRDTVIVKDSMWIEVKGDTIWIDRWHNKYIVKEIIDTVYSSDTVYQAREIPIEVIKEKNKYPIWPYFVLLTIFGLSGIWIYYNKKGW